MLVFVFAAKIRLFLIGCTFLRFFGYCLTYSSGEFANPTELKIHFFGNELIFSKKSFSTWLNVRCWYFLYSLVACSMAC